jgi:DNA-damage-inducible protein J
MNKLHLIHQAPPDVPTDPVEYDKWLCAQVQEAIDDPRPSIPHEEVMSEMRALIAQKRQRADSTGG